MINQKPKLRLAMTVSALALCHLPTGAAAQTEAQPAAARPIEAIVVTAQRREELARDVPITMNTFSGDQLAKAGIQSTLELTNQVPGLVVSRTGLFTLPAMRGVTTQITGPGADSNVALYLDGVYLPATMANTFDLPDVQQVEILKGPQGTLFGRNATGGAIRINTLNPEYEFGGKVQAAYASFDDLSIKGYVSIPLIDNKLSLGLAGLQRTSDGYYNDLRGAGDVGGIDSSLIRGKLLFEPTDNFRILLSGYYADREDGAHAYGFPLNGNTVARFDPMALIPTQPYDVATNLTPFQSVKNEGGSIKLELDIAAGTFTSITGYNKYEIDGLLDADYSYQPGSIGVIYYPVSEEEQFSQELTFSSDLSGPVNFTLGAFYVDGEGGWTPLGVRTASLNIGINSLLKTEAAAAFGEVFFDVTDRLSVIGGLRYSWEERSSAASVTSVGVKASSYNPIGQESWDSLTPRVSLIYALSDTSNIYFTYSEGFKSGVFNASATGKLADGSLPLVDPEKIKAYEVGYKGLVSANFDLNAAIFYYDYTDVQVTAYRAVNGVPLSLILNAAGAEIYGAEFEGNWAVTPQFDTHLNASYLDTEYTSFPNAAVLLPRTNGSGTILNNGNVATSIDASGAQMVRAPQLTVTASATYTVPVAIGEIDFTGMVYYSDEVNYDFAERIKQPAYTNLDARVAFRPNEAPFEIAVFGKNLTDEDVIGGTFITEIADGVSFLPPRSFGVQLNVDF